MHIVTGRLRERGEPDLQILDRLYHLCPTFRVHWAMWFDGRPYWILANRVAGEVYKAVARYRRDRLTLEKRAEAEQAGVEIAVWETDPRWMATVHGLELMEDGDYLVAKYTDEEFGTERMFEELQQVAQRWDGLSLEDQRARKRQQLKLEWEMARTERQRNAKMEEWLDLMKDKVPGFFEANEALAKEQWGYHMAGRRSVTQPGLKERVCDPC